MSRNCPRMIRTRVLRTPDRALLRVVLVALGVLFGLSRPSLAQCVTPPAELIGWWEGAANSRDTVGAVDGLLVNGATFAAGKVGQAFSLDGVDDYVTIPNNPGLALFSGPFTLELWLKLDSFADSYLTVMAKGATNRLWLSIRPDGKVENYPEIIGTTVLSTDTWYHIALVADLTHEYLYLNGNLEASVPRTLFVEAHGPVALGVAPSLDSEFVDGLIDEVSLYGRALTAAEIQAIHLADTSGKCRSAIYTFDGSVLDLDQWRVSEPLTDVSISQSDALFLVNNGGGGTFCFTPGNFGPGVGAALRRKLSGDFDIQVAFRDFSGPHEDHVQAFFQVFQDPNNQLHVKRIRGSTGDGIQTVAKVAGVFPLQSDTSVDPVASGTLRIVRTGDQISTYFDRQLEFSLTAFSGPVIVSMTLTAPPSSVEFDSFYIRSGFLIEPPVPCPGPPVANAGVDDSVDEGDLVFLDGTGSSDPDEDPLTYAWTQPAGPAVVLSDAASAAPSFTAPLVPMGGATLTFQLVVHDGLEFSEPDTVDITIVNINHPPVALAGDDQAVAETSPVALDGSNSYDPDGEDLTYTWTQTAGPPVTLFATDPAMPTFTAPLVGPSGATLTFELTVSDGEDSASDLVDVLVEYVNHDPVADAGEDQTRFEGAVVMLDAGGSADPDGDGLTYAWTQLSGPVVVLSGANAVVPSFTAPQVGLTGEVLVFSVLVDDGFGGFDDDEVAITVQDGNSAPSCELARPSSGELWPPNHKFVPISIFGVSDPENDAIQVTILSVTQDEPLNGQGDGDTAPDAVVQGDKVLLRAERSGGGNGRVYRITFTATDGFGGACTGTVSVCVPHSKSKNGPSCVDDGQIFDSTGP